MSFVPYDIKYRDKSLYEPKDGKLDKIQVDNGNAFDFGKTAEYYGRFRDIYPDMLFEKLYSLGVGTAGSHWLDLGTGTGVFPKDGGIFVKVYISYLKEEPVTQDSNALVKKINPNWHGAASALEDLRRHYFENPQMETFITEIPFTRESWHGRMLASRGVMASMNENQLRQFDQEHRAMLEEKHPEKFSIKHMIFLTWYKL